VASGAGRTEGLGPELPTAGLACGAGFSLDLGRVRPYLPPSGVADTRTVFACGALFGSIRQKAGFP